MTKQEITLDILNKNIDYLNNIQRKNVRHLQDIERIRTLLVDMMLRFGKMGDLTEEDMELYGRLDKEVNLLFSCSSVTEKIILNALEKSIMALGFLADYVLSGYEDLPYILDLVKECKMSVDQANAFDV